MARRRKRKQRGSIAPTLTWVVLALQAAMLLTLTVDASDPPRGGTFFQDLWALWHKPSFYPLVGLVIVGPPATWLAWTQRGGHRWLLVAGWVLFTAAVHQWHMHRLSVMLRVLWDHGSSI